MEQTDRISEMEAILDMARQRIDELNAAVENYAAIRGDLVRLFDYYGSDDWRRDYEDDEAGKLPTGLKRGVLSEDAVYDLITDNRGLVAAMLRAAADAAEKLL